MTKPRSRGSPTTASRIAVPLTVSGLVSGSKQARRLQHWMTKIGSPYVVTSGSSVRAPSPGATLGAPPVAGGAIGALYSYGDATFGGIGTATFTCDDQVVAFGHPLDLSGKTSLALTNADILRTITDPSQVFGPWKLGQITDTSGSINQDRLAGIAGITGTLPALTAVTSDLSDAAIGNARQARPTSRPSGTCRSSRTTTRTSTC